MLTLTHDELKQLTGKGRRDAQKRVLDSMGIRYLMRPDRTLAVLRSHVEVSLGSKIPAQREPELHL